MIVEFIGTPGAGKTTFMPVVMDHFKEQHYQAYPVLEAARPFAGRTIPGKIVRWLTKGRLQRFLLWQIFYAYSFAYRRKFARQHQALMESVLTFQQQRPIPEPDRNHVLHWFNHLTGSHEFLKAYARPGDMLIFDEGFVHRVVQLFASENEMPDLVSVANYLNLIPKPDLVIFPKASSAVCEKRVFERGVWERFRAKERGETSQFIKNAHQIVDFAVNFIKDQGWTVVEVDNDRENVTVSKLVLKRSLSELVVRWPEKVYSQR
jgi:thymidylate kinase